MPLFMVAIVEPKLEPRFAGDTEVREEQLILPPTPVLAEDSESAKTQAVLTAKVKEVEPGAELPAGERKTDVKRWKVIVRPFGDPRQ